MLEIKILAGAESKAFLVGLTKQIDRLHAITGGKALTALNAQEPSEDADVGAVDGAAGNEEEEDFAAPAAKPSAKGAAFEEENEELDFTAPPAAAKKAAPKAKKLTIDDVNDACKARAKAAGKKGREEVLAILKKKFKTESVSNIAEDQFPAVIAAMKVA